MEKFIVSPEGKPVCIEADTYRLYGNSREYREMLTEPDTHMPIINQEKLDAHPDKERLSKLIEQARAASEDEKGLVANTRGLKKERKNTAEKLDKDEVIATRARLNREDRGHFAGLKYHPSETHPVGSHVDVRVLWRDPAILDIAVPAPQPGYMFEKLHQHDYNFTPEEARDLLKHLPFFRKEEEVVWALYEMDPDNLAWKKDDAIKRFIYYRQSRAFYAALKGDLEETVIENLDSGADPNIAFNALHAAVTANRDDLASKILTAIHPKPIGRHAGLVTWRRQDT